MAEGDAHVYNNFKEQLLLKQIDCDTDQFLMALYSGTYAASDLDGNPVYAAAGEIGPANYVAGGQDIGTPVVTQDDTNDWAKWDDDGTNVVWNSLGASFIRKAILYDNTTASKWCLIVWEIATDSNGGNYTLAFNTNGIMLLT
jgi:hypothetical protein